MLITVGIRKSPHDLGTSPKLNPLQEMSRIHQKVQEVIPRGSRRVHLNKYVPFF